MRIADVDLDLGVKPSPIPGLLVGLSLGIAFGALMGIMFAPSPGTDLRHRISGSLRDWRERRRVAHNGGYDES